MISEMAYFEDSFQYFQVLVYNLGQIKWKIETTPPPKISDGKMASFGLHTPSSLIWGEGGISVPFYSVQDCSFI